MLELSDPILFCNGILINLLKLYIELGLKPVERPLYETMEKVLQHPLLITLIDSLTLEKLA